MRRVVAASLAVALWNGCGTRVGCPDGWRSEGGACVCAPGTTDVDDVCVVPPAPPGGEVGARPRDAGVRDASVRGAGSPDAGRMARDAAVRADTGDAASGGRDADAAVDAEAALPPNPPPGAPCPMSCASGRCDASGRCVEVATSTCADRIVAPDERCTRDQERAVDCYDCAPATCGDGVVQSDFEDCELSADGASLGARGWSARNCDRTTCRRTIYQPCEVTVDEQGSHDPCFEEGGELLACIDGICTAPSCRFDVSADKCMLAPCTELPGSKISGALGWCFIECDLERPCPFGLLCHLSYGRCIGPSHVRAARCGDLNERIEGGCPL